MKVYAFLLLAIGLLGIAGDALGIFGLDALGEPSPVAPTGPDTGAVDATRMFLEWRAADGERHELELTPEVCAGLRGPYHRRKVYGAVLTRGPWLARDPRGRKLLNAVLRYGLTGDAPVLSELGIEPGATDLALRYEPTQGNEETRLEVPLAP